MKKTLQILTLLLLAPIFCALLSSCGASGEDNPDAQITALSVGYLTENAYNNGNYYEGDISTDTAFENDTAHYMVIDLTVETLIGNWRDKSIKLSVQAQDSSALTMMVQDALTGKLERIGGEEGYHLYYSIPARKGKEKSYRTILKLTPRLGGNTEIAVSVSGGTNTAVTGKTSENASLTFKSPNLSYILQTDGTYRVLGMGECKDTEVLIPALHNGKTVTGIDEKAFRDCHDLTSIDIPAGVKRIGYGAFSGCSALTEISVHDNNLSFRSENGILFNKDQTKLICYPAGKTQTSYSVPSSVTSIGSYAFCDCSHLTSLSVPNNVTSIGSCVFRGCSSLSSISLPFIGSSAHGSSNAYLGYDFGASAYSENSKYVPTTLKTVVITGGSTIDYNAFYECASISTVIIPRGVTSIGYNAFHGCTGLTSISIPDSVKSIGAYAFYGCNRLTAIAIPRGVTSIGNSLFYGCDSLTGIVIPDGVTTIGNHAFYGCTHLTSLLIPESVTNIDDSAFRSCGNLVSVTFGGTKAKWSAVRRGSDWNTGTGRYNVICTDGTVTK